MSRTVDERVVSMQFDNRNFESNVQTSLSTLDKLKRSLNLTDAAKGLDAVSASAKNCDMSGMSNGVETIRAKFSALQVMGVTALGNIANTAVNAGKRIVSALTIDPIKTGFQEYETQINAVQTILANTKSKGTTLDDVNDALDELNTYADKTIYNFTEMTRNIGTFTAAGIDLKTSTNAIQGIANLAAVSGSTSQQASTAMYQLSQALATGTVKLMDWNSVVNAGMGGQVFQDALKKTSKELGTGAEAAIKAKGSFRESLQTGWLTSEVLTETLKKFTTSGANEYVAEYTGLSAKAVQAALDSAEAQYGEADAIDKASEALAKKSGKNKDEIKRALEFAKTAEDAATKVKTFSQLWDTLKEAAQSGWTQSWEIIVGDFEEAKALLTEVSDTIGGMIGKSADVRNKLLQGWKDLGGRTALIDSIKNAFEGVLSVVKPIKEAFREIFPPLTAKQLMGFTENLKSLTEKMKLSSDRADKVKRTFKGLFSILDIGKKIIVALLKPLFDLSQSKGISNLADLFLDIAAAIGDFFTSINNGFDTTGIAGGLSKIGSGISGFLSSAVNGFKGFGKILSSVGDWVSKVISKIYDVFKKTFTWIADNVSLKDVFAGLAGGGIFITLKKFGGLLDKIKDTIDNIFNKKDSGEGVGDKFKGILDSVKETLQSFTSGIKIASLVSIAIAVGILSAALSSIAKLDVKDISKGLFGIGSLLAMLSISFKSLTKSLTKFDSKGVVKSGIAMIAMSIAIKIIASALEDIGKLQFKDILKSVFAMGIVLLELSATLKLVEKSKVSLKTTVAILAISESCKILADALKKFGEMSWEEIGRGLSAMGGALLEVSAVIAILNKFGGGKSLSSSVSILILVKSLDDIANSLKKFGEMSWDEIRRGLSAMRGALTELSAVVTIVGKLAGFSSIEAAISIVILTKALEPICDALYSIALLSWEEIARGLVGMGGALVELGVITGLLGKLAGFSGLLGAVTILIVAQALKPIGDALTQIGQLSWDQIAKSLVGMGVALVELGVVTGLLGTFAPGAILGAVTILIVAQALKPIGDALTQIGQLSWDEIARGLVGMGGALTEIAVITGLLGNLGGLGAMIGAGSILIAVQGLGDIADALKKFGEMSWEEIGRGLSAMGAALGEIALGGLLNTLSILGSVSITNMAEPLGILADSVKKWSSVTIPENLGLQLGLLADGIMCFTFGGWGASAIAEVATPLGILADSVRKWAGVVVPENLGTQLDQLASGVKSFTFGGLGFGAISEVAAPLGTLADSVKKWSGVVVPEGLDGKLKSISDGVKSFTWAFAGGWSINAIVDPLGKLPDSIKKWNGITVPEGIDEQLKRISNGVKSFTWAFAGGWSLGAIVEPLSKLPDSLKKWNGITVPENIATGLKNISSGVKSFTWAFAGGWSIGTIVGPLGNLAKATKTLCSVKIPSDIGDKLKSIANGVKAFTGIGDISAVSGSIKSIASSVSKLSGISFESVNSGLNSFVSTIKKFGGVKIDVRSLTSSISAITSAISKMMKTVSSIIKSGKSSITSAMKTAMSGIPQVIKSNTNTIKSSASTLTSSFAKAISGKKNSVSSAFKTLISGAANAVKSKKSSMESAGKDLGSGLVAGINSKQTAVYNAAYKLGQKAVQGEKDGQKSNSPSKLTIQSGKWFGEGLVIGIDKMGRAVYRAGYNVGNIAVKSLSNSISRISDTINSDLDYQPTIRPVLDLSEVTSGAKTVNGLFNMQPSVGILSNVGSISTMMNRRNQNGTNNDVISAIQDLKKTIGKTSGDTYNVNGVTYDDGSNIADAVKSIVRAARVERRV